MAMETIGEWLPENKLPEAEHGEDCACEICRPEFYDDPSEEVRELRELLRPVLAEEKR